MQQLNTFNYTFHNNKHKKQNREVKPRRIKAFDYLGTQYGAPNIASSHYAGSYGQNNA